MTDRERLNKLLEIAEADSLYAAYRETYLESQSDYHRVVADQDPAAQNLLNTYAYTGRMMLQRLLQLACQHMDFPEGKK